MWAFLRTGALGLFLLTFAVECRHDSHSHESHESHSQEPMSRHSSHDSHGDLSQHQHHHHTIVHGPIHNHYYDDGRRQQQDESEEGEVYRFHVGGGVGPYGYTDHIDGRYKGFHVDLLWAVCKEAGKRCHYVVDPYTNCWYMDSDGELPGVGLLNNYYEGCLGFLPTAERLNSFNFSIPFTPDFAIGLYYKKGSVIADPTDLTGKKIGFVNGWAMSKMCLSRQPLFKGIRNGDYEAKLFDTPEDLVTAVLTGEVDAIWTFKANYDVRSMEVQAVGPAVYCSTGGVSLMARYSQQGLLDWWNEAFQRLVDSGDYHRLCEKSQRDHAGRGELYCLD